LKIIFLNVLKFEKRYKVRLRKIRVVPISFFWFFLKKLHSPSTQSLNHIITSGADRPIVENPEKPEGDGFSKMHFWRPRGPSGLHDRTVRDCFI
jgi:hypothetical protein